MYIEEDLCDGIHKLLDEVLCDQKDSKGMNRSYIYCATVLLEELYEIIVNRKEVDGTETKESQQTTTFKELARQFKPSENKGSIIRD